jgi:hypothetical protein
MSTAVNHLIRPPEVAQLWGVVPAPIARFWPKTEADLEIVSCYNSCSPAYFRGSL